MCFVWCQCTQKGDLIWLNPSKVIFRQTWLVKVQYNCTYCFYSFVLHILEGYRNGEQLSSSCIKLRFDEMHLFINIYHIASLFPQHAISLIVKYLMRMANMFLTFSHNQTQQKRTACRFDELCTEGNYNNTKKFHYLFIIINSYLIFQGF